MTLTFLEQQIEGYQKLLFDAAMKFRKRAEDILDQIAEFDKRLEPAKKAFAAGDLERGKDGNYKNEDTAFILIMFAEAKGLSPDMFSDMTDEALFNFATDAFNNSDLVRKYKTDEYQIVSKIADVLDKHRLNIGTEFKEIMNDDL